MDPVFEKFKQLKAKLDEALDEYGKIEKQPIPNSAMAQAAWDKLAKLLDEMEALMKANPKHVIGKR